MKMKLLYVVLSTILLICCFSPVSAATNTKHEAIVVTWKNDAGYWFAVGPVQNLWAGCKTETEAIELASGLSSTEIDEIPYNKREVIGKYNIYKLGRALKSYEVDAAEWTEKKGWIRWDWRE